jgi:PAS domain S-box-containing protein
LATEKKKSILLVEDQALIALSKAQELKIHGYNVTHVLNGEKAIELIKNDLDNFDLILMDIDLGKGIDGTQAAEEILKLKHIPVLFLSSHTEQDIVERTEKITSYGYVVKDSGITVLDASIKMAFKLFRANQELENQKLNLEISNREVLESKKLSEQVISSVSEGIIVYGIDLKYQIWNSFMEKLSGIKAEDVLGKDPIEVFPFLEGTGVINRLKRALAGEIAETIETRFIIEPGVNSIWTIDTSNPLRNSEGEIKGVIRIIKDITEKKRQEQLYILENEALEMYSIKNCSIEEVLSKLLNGIQLIHPSMLCTVLKLKENKLYCWSSPHLPLDFNKAIDGLEIGVGQGVCGSAAFLKKKVIVSNILTDPLTLHYRDLAEKYGLKACWSHPLLDAKNKVLATFAIYLKSARLLTDPEELTIERAQIIIKNIIEHRHSENQYKMALERVSDAFVSLDTNWRYTYMNKKAGEIFNRDPNEMVGKQIWVEFPEGVNQAFYKAYYKAVETQQYIQIEEYYPPYDRWFVNHIYPSPDGLTIYFNDITLKKQQEIFLKERISILEKIEN